MATPDYYAVLGVPRSATPADIRCSYLDLVRKLHPDRIGISGTDRLQQVNEAYEVLSDPPRRKRYDVATEPAAPPTKRRPRAAGRSEATPATPHSSRRHDGATAADVVDFRPDNWIGRSVRRQTEPVEFGVQLSAAEARRGVVFPLRVPVTTPCDVCAAHVQLWGCDRCLNTGEVRRLLDLWVTLRPHRRSGEVLEIDGREFGFPGLRIRLHLSVC